MKRPQPQGGSGTRTNTVRAVWPTPPVFAPVERLECAQLPAIGGAVRGATVACPSPPLGHTHIGGTIRPGAPCEPADV
jgi:hypothetical protein